ncbi:IS3 family transposase [Frondihabitans sp. PAMC 28766]|uniref:IS3 family transposase n=1 Tax=Frondihabitans sp. PAMC 28766 TaxID=1795630 RepID=UPI0012FFC7DE|nr:IS3 family transposase [Frondihabitans sp. PAMC 28766]
MRSQGHRVESTCAVLRSQGVRVAGRSYRVWRRRPASVRTIDDAALIARFHQLRQRDAKGRQRPEVLYGRRKMTAWLARSGFPDVSKHTVDRVMRAEGMNGLVRGRKTSTTIPAKNGKRAGDLLNREFTAPRPNHTWVTDFTYVPTWSGFVYVAFAIDLFSRAIVGWQASTVKDTEFVELCLRMALWRRDQTDRKVQAGMIHHSDAGSQYTSIRFTETVALEGLVASIGSVGDAYDNAAAETGRFLPVVANLREGDSHAPWWSEPRQSRREAAVLRADQARPVRLCRVDGGGCVAELRVVVVHRRWQRARPRNCPRQSSILQPG